MPDRVREEAEHIGREALLNAARDWLHRRITQALGPAAERERLAGLRLDRAAALSLAAEALGG